MALTKDQKYLIGAGAGAALLYLGVLNPLLKFLGIKKSDETKQVDAAGNNPQSPFSPVFYKNVPGAILMTRASADNMAKIIYDSIGALNDCEECVIGVFKSLKFQTQCSYLAEIFFINYKQDLLQFIRGGWWPYEGLSDAHLTTIVNYVKGLPIK